MDVTKSCRSVQCVQMQTNGSPTHIHMSHIVHCWFRIHVRCVVSSPMCTSCVCVAMCMFSPLLLQFIEHRKKNQFNFQSHLHMSFERRVNERRTDEWQNNSLFRRHRLHPGRRQPTLIYSCILKTHKALLQSICRKTRMAFRCERALIQWCNHFVMGIQTSERAGVETAQFSEFYIPPI